MTYGLTILAIGNTAFLEITPDEFRQIKTAKLIAMTALAIEEKFEILVENYSEYERTLLDLTLGKMIRMNFDAVSFAADRQLINRRIANLLMAARLYIDQAKHDVATIYPDRKPVADSVTAAFSREYDSSVGYRVMEGIRNHVQHRSLPVGKLSYPSAWRGADGEGGRECGIGVELDVEGLRDDKEFKRAVLADIEREPRSRDVTLLTREFVGALANVHKFIRDLTGRDVETGSATLVSAIDRARKEIGRTAGLAAVERSGDEYSEMTHIPQALLDRLDEKRKYYTNLKSLARWYVSGSIGAGQRA